ncbi:MAG: 23S rRNA (uracil(1939)-C(5))-methyltransferase RlmD [Elusimicrobia bacterium]|nr:23S rRNA (uracil(1939)-C(5))-methyltransferase RlmD [Elusimicrobiota bacterium]MBK7545874.1 23S rRNA (uracil(1939)-C(5))-methyltransferase RlmD [Elusimicrobiota bacterium]MBK7575138.1 23S rRNA (uracil(1939)-C(5))-methyltransferase RlmD [Elusimicrobiota bacterium]MBK7687598.1 23S rRNA (uracil(1939)-C(5))-methyltransferase RlmD [Elusimicrobiota bacterium]MBK8125484.1 23S rRNA (uracil(1939)-C(5))-methyltransferase RlmD [Elusimicrobiota bacterium]
MTLPDIALERLSLGGEAVGRLPPEGEGRPGRVVFVAHGAPGDRAVLDRIKNEKSFARAGIASLVAPGPDRVEPRCPHFFRPGRAPADVCGGCDWQHLAYPAQIDAKRNLLSETFQRIAKIPRPNVLPTVGADSPEAAWRYRNKVQVPLARSGHRVVAGFYAPGSHTVVPFDDCPVQDERSVAVVRAVRGWAERTHLPLYDARTGRGGARHLLVRTAARDVLVALVTTSERAPALSTFARDLKKALPFVTAVFHNVNDREGNVVLGPRWVHLGGKDHLEESLLGLRFRLSPGAFFQVNHAMAEKLYGLAVDMAAAGPADVVWELYAGVGAMGQLIARRAKTVWAVEENHRAVRDGIGSLALNGIDNLRFRQGRCELVLARRLLPDAPTVVVLDPPRAGCERTVLKAVMKAAPRRVVYVSCDPGTLARDAAYLSTGGYLLQKSVPVDLFPQTAHIESVSLFERK